ncbi:restriction endonuclease [Candidatus Saccharibacteria bacterium]|nr:restriction endonuclease [Candidatus Saccharibacteria bacterium]
MNNEVKNLINKAVESILVKMSSKTTIVKLDDKHAKKIHFIPKSYRIFGGMLQSMNIQFGNFIEELMTLLIANENDYEIVAKYSGNKSNAFTLSQANESLIDNYISKCQLSPDGFCNTGFPKLQTAILSDTDTNQNTFKHDIDLLFKNKTTNKYYYLEIKYNDDHDTGKFVDINRKFIKTYAYLANELKVKNIAELTPILFFFNNKKMKGNPYIPEATNIRRGESFFNAFLQNISYKDLNDYMTNLSESDEVKKMFNDLYDKIVKR